MSRMPARRTDEPGKPIRTRLPKLGKTHPRGPAPSVARMPRFHLRYRDPMEDQADLVSDLSRLCDGGALPATPRRHCIEALRRGFASILEESACPSEPEIIRRWVDLAYERHPTRTTPLSELRLFHAAEGFAFGHPPNRPVRLWAESLAGDGIRVAGWDGSSEDDAGVAVGVVRRADQS